IPAHVHHDVRRMVFSISRILPVWQRLSWHTSLTLRSHRNTMPPPLAPLRIAVLALTAVATWSTCAQAQSEVLVQHRVVEGPPSAPVYRWRGFHIQPRLMATFGINASHEFGQACPGDRCSVQLPLGAAAGVFAGYSWNDTSVHLLLLGLVDYSRADRDDARATRSDGDIEANADGGF